MKYSCGTEIRVGDHVLVAGNPGRVEDILNGENNSPEWSAELYPRGILLKEPRVFGTLMVAEKDFEQQEIEFVRRSET